MALNGKAMGDAVAAAITASDASIEAKAAVKKVWEDVGDAICDYIVANIEVKIPAGSVIIMVSGGSGAPAVGAPNASPIGCTVS